MHVQQLNAEAGFLFVLFIQRHLHQRRALTLEVHLASGDFQGDRFHVVHLGGGELIDVGQLLALGIDLEVVRVALPGQQAGVARSCADPRVEGRVIRRSAGWS